MTPILVLAFVGSSSLVFSQPGAEPETEFRNMSVEHNVVENGVKGLRVQLIFDVLDAKDLDLFARLRFRKVIDGEYLKDANRKFHDIDGYVAAFAALRPIDAETAYTLAIFVPVRELDLSASEKHRLDIDADVIYKNGDMLGHLNYFIFDYDSNRTLAATKLPDVEVKSLRIEQDAFFGGKRGMRVTASLRLVNLKEVPSNFKATIVEADGTAVKATERMYSDKEGNLAVSRELTVASDSADVSDIQIFIPYSELGLYMNKVELALDVDVFYQQGGLIKHLDLYDLSFRSSFLSGI